VDSLDTNEADVVPSKRTGTPRPSPYTNIKTLAHTGSPLVAT
jgi:hypothetical protein